MRHGLGLAVPAHADIPRTCLGHVGKLAGSMDGMETVRHVHGRPVLDWVYRVAWHALGSERHGTIRRRFNQLCKACLFIGVGLDALHGFGNRHGLI